MENIEIHLDEIPPEILFNRWKHHLKFLQGMLYQAKEGGEDVIARHILSIGNNITDLYEGPLSPAQISRCILFKLKEKGIDSARDYLEWIAKNEKNYAVFRIMDRSQWVLLPGVLPHYIHIHPARDSPFTCRVKALTLKTAIWVSYEVIKGHFEQIDLELINKIRVEKLKVSPVKSVSQNHKLFTLLNRLLNF